MNFFYFWIDFHIFISKNNIILLSLYILKNQILKYDKLILIIFNAFFDFKIKICFNK